jgi:hypothetical protein
MAASPVAVGEPYCTSWGLCCACATAVQLDSIVSVTISDITRRMLTVVTLLTTGRGQVRHDTAVVDRVKYAIGNQSRRV